MFRLIHNSKLDRVTINKENKDKLINNLLPKYPIKCAEFSSIKNKKENSTSKEIKTSYVIEDTRCHDGLLIILTNIGTIYIYDIYSKKIKKIVCFTNELLRAKGIHINTLRNSFIVTLFSSINDINNIQCHEISLEVLKRKEKINIFDFARIIKSEEFLDSECYVQFDEYNNVILTRNILRTNKIWNFENYSKNFEFTYSNLNEIRMTGGAVLVCEKTNQIRKYNIHIFDVNNGKKLYGCEIIFHPDKKIIFFELLRNYLFVKQQGNYPLYIDLLTKQIKIIYEQIDNEAFFMYSGNTNKFILVSLDRYLIFDINGDLLKKIINNNLSIEIKQNDICSPINNYPFIICWHLAKVSFSESESPLRCNSKSSKSSLSNACMDGLNINNDNAYITNKKKKNIEITNNNLFGSDISSIRSVTGAGNFLNVYFDDNFNLNSDNNRNNLNDISFIESRSKFKDEYSIDGLYGEHKIDIVYMDNVNYIRQINFKFDFNQSVESINYIREMNSVLIISCYGEIYEIKL